jgi:hypothetical protein
MAKRLTMAVLMATVLAASASLWAAPTVTLILSSGEKVRGELIDLGGVGYTIRVGGADRQIPAGQVAVIDFTGAPFRPAELDRVRQGQALAVFHSGDTFEGRLIDIGGNEPLRMTFSTSGGNRDVSSSELSRVYLSRWEGMPAQSGAATLPGEAGPSLDPGGAGITIPANPCWTNTGRSVRRGQSVHFVGTGEIQLSADAQDIAGVAGSRTGRKSASAPIPGALAGALIGRVGNGQPFGIGDQQTALAMSAAGQLWLGINDDHCGDNRGQFKVQVTILR